MKKTLSAREAGSIRCNNTISMPIKLRPLKCYIWSTWQIVKVALLARKLKPHL